MVNRLAPSVVFVFAGLIGAAQSSPTLAAQVPQSRTEFASLLEQALFAEEQSRDFVKALELFERARAAAATAKDAAAEETARRGAERVRARSAGVAQAPSEAQSLESRIAGLLRDYLRQPDGTQQQADAANEVVIFGASAVGIIERGIEGPPRLEFATGAVMEPPNWVERHVSLLARMTAPEAGAALDRLLSSPDPLVRRSVATCAQPDRHRAQLLRALKDPAPQVAERAISSLANSNDPALADLMRNAALKDNSTAMEWLLDNARAGQLVDMIADKALPAGVRTRACAVLAGARGGQASKAALDAILSLLRELGEESHRQAAMESLFKLVTETWPRIPQELLRQLEDALRTDAERIPQPLGDRLLHRIGTARSLPYLVERYFTTTNPNLRIPDPNSMLARCGVGDFVAVSAALGLVPSRDPRQDVFGSALFQWLRGAAESSVSSANLVQGLALQSANSRGMFLQGVVVPWIAARISEDGEVSAAERAAVGSELAPVAQELFESSDGGERRAGARVMGVLGDPRFLPALLRGCKLGDNTESLRAVRRVVAQQPARAADVIAFLLGDDTSWEGDDFVSVFSALFPSRAPDDVLKLAVESWTSRASANAHRRLMYLVAKCVPGEAGDQFLMAHYRELDSAAWQARQATLLRFAASLYPPGVDLIGEALRDPSSSVRTAAHKAFDAYRTQAVVFEEFQSWASRAARRDGAAHEFMLKVQGNDPGVVGVAALALGALSVPESRPLIQEAIQRFETNAEVVATLRRALEMLGN